MKFLLPIFVFALVWTGCDQLYPVDTGTSQGRGVVRRVDYEHHMITLDHELIPNLLQPMTFAYPVQKDTLMAGILPEDTVVFTLTEPQPGSFIVQSLRKVGSPKLRTVPIFESEKYPVKAPPKAIPSKKIVTKQAAKKKATTSKSDAKKSPVASKNKSSSK